MNKRCHLKLTALVCSSVFPFIGICQKFVFLFGSIEPDINFFTYIKGHGDERVSNYILRIIDFLKKKDDGVCLISIRLVEPPIT